MNSVSPDSLRRKESSALLVCCRLRKSIQPGIQILFSSPSHIFTIVFHLNAIIYPPDLSDYEQIRGDLYVQHLIKKIILCIFTEDNALEIILQETGKVFAGVLEDAGVYKNTAEGKAAFLKFVDYVNWNS